jgi:hypothetical protein
MADQQAQTEGQQETVQDSGTTTQPTTTNTYQAPLYRFSPHDVPGEYIVAFCNGHTIAKHFEYVGREFEVKSLKAGYSANMDDELLETVRGDAGVEYVENNTRGYEVDDDPGTEVKETPQPTTTNIHQAPLYRPPNEIPGRYIVKFRTDHTLSKHFDVVGREFEAATLRRIGYVADLDDELLAAVRRDPGVERVKNDSYGQKESEAPQDSCETTQPAATTTYQAELGGCAPSDFPTVYVVVFRDGHTLAKHFEAIGQEFKIGSMGDIGYFAIMDDALLTAVRSDPGVDFVECGTDGEAQSEVVPHGSLHHGGEETQPTSQGAYRAPWYRHPPDNVPGSYFVAFYAGHTIARHFEAIGRAFDVTASDGGYGAALDDQLLSAVRSDPGVMFVEDNVRGKAELVKTSSTSGI